MAAAEGGGNGQATQQVGREYMQQAYTNTMASSYAHMHACTQTRTHKAIIHVTRMHACMQHKAAQVREGTIIIRAARRRNARDHLLQVAAGSQVCRPGGKARHDCRCQRIHRLEAKDQRECGVRWCKV